MLGEITKADLEMAVFLSQGEVDRYRIMLEHDIRAFELMDEQLASAETVRLPWSGTLTSRGVYSPADALNFADDVITHVDGAEARTDETGHVYRAPVM